VRHTYNLLDYYNPDTEISSMARTTGYTCAAMVRLVAREMWDEPGVAAPEMVGRRKECYDFVLEHLAERDVHLFHTVESLD
ncbi:MAG TPA: saccharopine dehydrogenase C-terminal domain-containing protein, partial [Longimicrobiales bacterium]|nr:saccharopine dehydrogenase C-terminal domain-containing protein [Longimicrobiales bacterium]